jgi:hypothetical protein
MSRGLLYNMWNARVWRRGVTLPPARVVVFAASTAIASLTWPLLTARWLLGVAVNRPFAVTESISMARFVVPMVAMSAAVLGASRKRVDVWSWSWRGSWISLVVGVVLLATAEYFRKGESLKVFFEVLLGGVPGVVLPAAAVGGVFGATIGALFSAATAEGAHKVWFATAAGVFVVGHVMAAIVGFRFFGVLWP